MKKKKRQRECSSSDSSESESRLKKKPKKKKRKRRHSSTSSDASDSSSSDSASFSSSSDRKRNKLRKKKKKDKIKKSDKLKKKSKKNKKAQCSEQPSASSINLTPTLIGPALPGSGDPIGPAIPAEILAGVKQEEIESRPKMAPMTKEEWEKRQSVVRRVFDETTGRHRLIKGDGEVLEEIVSRDRHMEINRQATLGDGLYFQSKLPHR